MNHENVPGVHEVAYIHAVPHNMLDTAETPHT
jgi:hypothetical protein